MNECRVCKKSDAVKGEKECAKCWKFYQRADQKFNQQKSRGVAVKGFANRVELAIFLKSLYDTKPKCHYTGVPLTVEEFGKEDTLRRYLEKNPHDKKVRKELDEYVDGLKNRAFGVDRVVSVDEYGLKMPYTRDNIVLCTTTINLLKGQLTHEQFLDTAYSILKNEIDSSGKTANKVIERIRELEEQHREKTVPPTEEYEKKVNGLYEEDSVKKRNKQNKRNKRKGNKLSNRKKNK